MNILNSNYKKLCHVNLPYAGRQKYMHAFSLENPVMATGFEDYLEPVRQLCTAAGATVGTAYMTVDEKIITSGMSQRRPKPHVDGCFFPSISDWSHGWPPQWLHRCNSIPLKEFKRMPVIVAASEVGCRAWRGRFVGEPKNDGDLSHLSLGGGEILPANFGYLLSADCIHESMIQPKDIQRTFLRIALPTNFFEAEKV